MGSHDCACVHEGGGSWVGGNKMVELKKKKKKESACNSGDAGSIPGSGRSSGEGNGNPLQCSCLENPMDRGAWQATDHGIPRVRHNIETKPPT